MCQKLVSFEANFRFNFFDTLMKFKYKTVRVTFFYLQGQKDPRIKNKKKRVNLMKIEQNPILWSEIDFYAVEKQ